LGKIAIDETYFGNPNLIEMGKGLFDSFGLHNTPTDMEIMGRESRFPLFPLQFQYPFPSIHFHNPVKIEPILL
jgi:hypothetical protein